MDKDELETKIAQLEKLGEERTNLMSISAHELRTLLTSLKWMLRMLVDGDVGALTTEQKHLLSKGFENTERMISIVGEMLVIGHTANPLEATKEKEVVDIVELIDSILFNFTGESYKKGVEMLFLKPDNGMTKISIHTNQVRVILQNLIENAIKYSSHGDRVFISVSDTGTYIRISIRDTGIGILKEDQPQIFNKFFRAPNAQKHEAVGTGLGLYTSKLIAEMEGGELSFTSIEKVDDESEHGTTFFLDLPKVTK